MDGTHHRTIQVALKVLGNSKDKLAVALGVPVPELEQYLAAQKPLPAQMFLKALDIANNGTQKA